MEKIPTGKKIRLLCKNSGLKQKQISRYLGINEITLRQIQSGKSYLPIEKIISLCDLFGLSYTEFIQQDNPKARFSFSKTPFDLSCEELKAISDIHRIANNLREMESVLQGN